MAKATSLLKAYNEGSIPPEGAIIVTSRFDTVSPCSIYEITICGPVENVLAANDGFLFEADGWRIHVLVEPPAYTGKDMEPFEREAGHSIPLRFSELEIITGMNNERIMISLKPEMVLKPFVIPYTEGDDFTFIFYLTADVHAAIRKFMADVFYNDSGLTREDAIAASHRVIGVVNKSASEETDQ